MDHPEHSERGDATGAGERSRARAGSVDRSQVRHLKQHELDTAARLARCGFHVVFRRPDDHSTADAYVNGMRTEFKRSSSGNPDSIERRIRRKRKLKGPRYVLDVTDSPLPVSKLTPLMQRLCARFRGEITSIMVVDGSTEPITVALAGEEVPLWRM